MTVQTCLKIKKSYSAVVSKRMFFHSHAETKLNRQCAPTMGSCEPRTFSKLLYCVDFPSLKLVPLKNTVEFLLHISNLAPVHRRLYVKVQTEIYSENKRRRGRMWRNIFFLFFLRQIWSTLLRAAKCQHWRSRRDSIDRKPRFMKIRRSRRFLTSKKNIIFYTNKKKW